MLPSVCRNKVTFYKVTCCKAWGYICAIISVCVSVSVFVCVCLRVCVCVSVCVSIRHH